MKQPDTRIGFWLVAGGLLVQIAASFFWSPGAFIVAVTVGIPLVLAGAVLLGMSVRLAQRQGGQGGDRGAEKT